IRRLRREAVGHAGEWHEPRPSANELIAGVNGELSPDERKVLDHFFELFARSMERTQAATPPPAPVAEPATTETARGGETATETATGTEPVSQAEVPRAAEAAAAVVEEPAAAAAEPPPAVTEPPAA